MSGVAAHVLVFMPGRELLHLAWQVVASQQDRFACISATSLFNFCWCKLHYGFTITRKDSKESFCVGLRMLVHCSSDHNIYVLTNLENLENFIFVREQSISFLETKAELSVCRCCLT